MHSENMYNAFFFSLYKSKIKIQKHLKNTVLKQSELTESHAFSFSYLEEVNHTKRSKYWLHSLKKLLPFSITFTNAYSYGNVCVVM
jgi:hypothetical protein